MVFVKQKILQKKQVNEHKMTKRQIYKKFTNLSEKKLNTKNNKKTLSEVPLLNDVEEKKQEV